MIASLFLSIFLNVQEPQWNRFRGAEDKAILLYETFIYAHAPKINLLILRSITSGAL